MSTDLPYEVESYIVSKPIEWHEEVLVQDYLNKKYSIFKPSLIWKIKVWIAKRVQYSKVAN